MPAPFVCVLKLNYNGQGCEERFVLKADISDHAAALVKAQQIAWGRTAFLGLGCELIYARVSQLGPSSDKRTCVLPYPLGPHPSWQGGVGVGDTNVAPNDPTTCFQMTAETAVGKWGNRYIRMIPDSWVVNRLMATGVLPYFQEPDNLTPIADMSPAGNGNHLSVCQSFWSYLRINTSLPKKNGPTDYTLRDIAAWVYQQVTNKKMGKRFRLSAGKAPAR